jgi:hypothetical protein
MRADGGLDPFHGPWRFESHTRKTFFFGCVPVEQLPPTHLCLGAIRKGPVAVLYGCTAVLPLPCVGRTISNRNVSTDPWSRPRLDRDAQVSFFFFNFLYQYEGHAPCRPSDC